MEPQYFSSMIEIASKNKDINSFFIFCNKVHELSNCKDEKCEMGISVGVLGLVLADPLKTYDERKGFFISHCGNFAKVFKSTYNLRQNESYVLNLLGGLKFLREEKEHRDREESVNNNNNNNYNNNTFEEKNLFSFRRS